MIEENRYEPILVRVDGTLGPIDFSMYSDNVPLVNSNAALGFINRIKDVTSLLVRPRTMGDFMTAMFFVDAMRYRGYRTPELVLPYFPGARQDRINDKGDFLFTARSVAEIINSKNFPRVIVLDPHSDVAPALVDRCQVVPVLEAVFQAGLRSKDYAAIVAPDAGAAKKAQSVAGCFGIPLVHAWKTRSIKDGVLTRFGHEPILPETVKHTKRLLIVDDICDGGGTFLSLGQILKDQGYDLDLFVTHGIFSKGTKSLLQIFDSIYTTDSMAIRTAMAKTVPICDLLMKM